MENKPDALTRLVSKCSFKDTIERVFEVITDFSYFAQVMNGFVNDISFVKGKSLAEVGSEYSCMYENLYYINMTVISIVNNLNFKKIVLKPKESKTLPLDFEIIQYLYWDSIEQTTLYIKELFIRKSPISLTNESIQKYKNDQLDITKRMKQVLGLMTIGYEQEESINIKFDSENLFKILSNMKLLTSLIPLLAKGVTYTNDILVEGTRIKINSKVYECEYEVIKLVNTNFIKEIVLQTQGKSNLAHVLRLNILEICDGISFISVKHKFTDIFNKKFLDTVLDYKRKILSCLKKGLEGKN